MICGFNESIDYFTLQKDYFVQMCYTDEDYFTLQGQDKETVLEEKMKYWMSATKGINATWIRCSVKLFVALKLREEYKRF